MYQYVLRKISSLLEAQAAVFSAQEDKKLLRKVNKDLEQFKHINFYHPQAGEQLARTLSQLKDYDHCLRTMRAKLKRNPSPSEAESESLVELDKILTALTKKITKLKHLTAQIPEGILDVKRAFCLKDELSSVKKASSTLYTGLDSLRKYLTELNQNYVALVQAGGPLLTVLWKTSCFYWQQLAIYRNLLTEQINSFKDHEASLTGSGALALRCLVNALRKMPDGKTIEHALAAIDYSEKESFLNAWGFCNKNALACCTRLEKLNKRFFYLPHNNQEYHFDYDPQEDLARTGGDCFGQSMMLIAGLAEGKLKWLCPEPGVLNHQLDQSRPFPAKSELASVETLVAADSEHDSIQWDELQTLFSDKNMPSGSLCGLTFAQNDYTMSQRDFTAGHISVVAKLDPKHSPYNYIVFEKEFGVFGLADEAALALVLKNIMALYQGMNYSITKLVKYEDATKATYNLVSSFSPVTVEEAAVHAPASVVGMFKAKPDEHASPIPSLATAFSNLFGS